MFHIVEAARQDLPEAARDRMSWSFLRFLAIFIYSVMDLWKKNKIGL